MPKYLATNKVVKRKIANIGIYTCLNIQYITNLSFKFFIFRYNCLIFNTLYRFVMICIFMNIQKCILVFGFVFTNFNPQIYKYKCKYPNIFDVLYTTKLYICKRK